jgi:hypothetical protein
MTGPPTLASLMADPGELDVSCLDCHHNRPCQGRPCYPAIRSKRRFPSVERVPLFGLWIKAC